MVNITVVQYNGQNLDHGIGNFQVTRVFMIDIGPSTLFYALGFPLGQIVEVNNIDVDVNNEVLPNGHFRIAVTMNNVVWTCTTP